MTHTELTRFLARAAHYPAEAGGRRNALFDGIRMREAAVLLGIVAHENQWQVLLTRRSRTLPQHAGQIALAGGRRDKTDAGPTHTALRETAEETGIAPDYWQTFPPLAPYRTPSGYAVVPVPAVCPFSPPTRPNAGEVDEIFYLPLDLALDKSAYTSRPFQYRGRNLSSPALPYLHYDIWGLTAMILYDLAARYGRHAASEHLLQLKNL